MGMRGGDCRRQPVRALLAGARASTRRARLMAHLRHPAGCAAHSLSRFARLSGSSSKIGCPRWIRTIIGGFRVRCPTVGRQGSISGEPGGSCNLTNVRLKVGCRSAVASGPLKWSLRQDLHPHWPRSRRGASTWLGYTGEIGSGAWNRTTQGMLMRHAGTPVLSGVMKWWTATAMLRALPGANRLIY